MDIFRTPGAALEGGERKNFDETKDLIDSATNDFLVRADWNANMACVDKVNALRSATVMSEVAFLLRKKIASKSAQTVGLTIQLIGVFVNNCGSRFHGILNDERFTRAIADAVRYFSKRPGHDSKDTTDVALDLIQSWGEAFLPRRRDYYHIVDLYFNLRKEGLPFKPQQFDPNRVPIFVDSNSGKALDNTDAILAASLASELALQEEQEERRRHRGGHHQDTHHSHSAGHSHDRPRSRQEEYHDEPSRAYGGSPTYGGDSSSGSAESTAEVVQSLRSCMFILKDLILAAVSVMDFRQNEVAQDVLVQLQVYQSKMPSLIEQGLMTDPEGVEALFALNEDSQSLTSMFNKMKNGEVGLLEGQRQVRGISCGGGESTETFQSVAPAPRHGHHGHQGHHDGHGGRPHSRASPSPGKGAGGADLLDMDFADFPPPAAAAARHSPAQGHGHHGHQDPFQQHQQHYRSSPVQGHHSSGHPSPGHPQQGHSHVHPPAARHSPHMMEPVHGGSRLPPPPHAHDPFAPVQAAPRHTHSPHMMHPPAPLDPPQQPHTSKPEGIVRLASDDPFTTDSLDVLFTGTPVVPAPHAQHAPAHATPAKGKEQVVSQQPSDPFSPDALDALFDTKPPAKKQPDPFSEEALDALFVTPAPQGQAHHGHHAPQQGYPAQQHQYQQQQGYPQQAYPSHQQQQGYPQQGYHQPPQAHAYPPQQYQQPPHGYPQQGYPQGQGHAPQHAARPPQQHNQHQQYQDQSSANPFDLI